MASIRAVGVYCVARLLVAVHGVNTLLALSRVPSRVRLHAVAISQPRWSAHRSTLPIAIGVAVTLGLSLGKVAAAGREAVLVVVSAAAAAAVIAAPSASVAAHDISLVGAH